MASPTARTLTELRRRGLIAQVVERWIAQRGVRVDLFGCIDIIALDGLPGVLGVQATSGSNVSAHVKKILEECTLNVTAWLEAGNRLQVWAWTKYKRPIGRKLWGLRTSEIVLAEGYLTVIGHQREGAEMARRIKPRSVSEPEEPEQLVLAIAGNKR